MIAGDGVAGYQDGPRPQARFNAPIGLAVDTSGRLIVADTYNDRIRAIAPDGSVTTIAGSAEPGLLDGAADLARFDTPCGVAIDPSGRIYVADTGQQHHPHRRSNRAAGCHRRRPRRPWRRRRRAP